MKVLHVVNISFVLPYYIGGQFDFFSDKGYELYVACSPSDDLEVYSKEKKFTNIPVRILRKINPFMDLIAIIKLVSAIKKNNIDIVVGHTPKGALLGMTASYIVGIKKRIYFRHGIMYETSTGFKRSVLKFLEKFTGSLATKVICVSPSVLKISNTVKLSKKEINVILNKGTCNGIDSINQFNPEIISNSNKKNLERTLGISENDIVIGYTGRLVKDKGIEELIEAWVMVKKKYHNAKLLLIGPFEKRDALNTRCSDFIKNEESIIWTGQVSDTFNYYYLMDVFILPSYREGFPTVVLEASAMKLPVITSRSTGCIDSIIENQTGIFTEISPDAIFNSIAYYIQNPELRVTHGLNGREYVIENFQQQRIWSEIYKILCE
jgi:glycosyltransferase involved in cell wall biosynthesis